MRYQNMQIKPCLFYVFVLFLPVVGICRQTTADIVYLKNGGQLQGRIKDRGMRKIEVIIKGGSIEVLRSDILRIEKKPLPEDVFAGYLKQAEEKRDADACVKLARWAFQHELNEQYVQGLRMALLIDRKHAEARRLLQDYKIHYQTLPHNDRAVQKMLDDMGPGFTVLRSGHYRICYNCSDIFADMTAARLEELYRQFMLFFEDRNFQPAPLSDRLEVVLFDNKQQFQAFARKIAPEMVASSGFYSGKTRRCYFYDFISGNNRHLQELTSQVRNQQRELDETRRKVLNNHDPNVRYMLQDSRGIRRNLTRAKMLRELADRQKLLDRQRQKIETFYRTHNISVTIHEGTHQLAYHTGIHSIYYDNPTWLVEGLALYFEANDGKSWDGPGRVNELRWRDYIKGNPPGSKIELAALLTRDKLFNLRSSYSTPVYAAAWSLFYYMVNRRHEQLFDYIFDLSLRMSNQPYSDKQRITDFEKYFGKLEDVQWQWRRFMNGVSPAGH